MFVIVGLDPTIQFLRQQRLDHPLLDDRFRSSASQWIKSDDDSEQQTSTSPPNPQVSKLRCDPPFTFIDFSAFPRILRRTKEASADTGCAGPRWMFAAMMKPPAKNLGKHAEPHD